MHIKKQYTKNLYNFVKTLTNQNGNCEIKWYLDYIQTNDQIIIAQKINQMKISSSSSKNELFKYDTNIEKFN